MGAKKNSTPVIVTVHRPELTPEERAKRMAEIKKAAADLIVAQMKIHAARTSA